MSLPILYHKSHTGKIHSWQVWSAGDLVYTEYGQIDGVKQTTFFRCIEKNVGKSNYITAEEQAIIEARALHKFKLDRKYRLTIEEASKEQMLPMLAHDYHKEKKKPPFPFFVQPKLDGVRCLAYWDEGSIVLMSRSGKPYDIEHISSEIARILPKGKILDGEVYIHGRTFQEIVTLIKNGSKYAKNKEFQMDRLNLQFHCYDIMDDSDMIFIDRNKDRDTLFGGFESEIVIFVDTWAVNNEEDLRNCNARFIEDGYEGTMIRTAVGLYDWGFRSHDLLKMKTFQDAEYRIIGAEQGIGKFAGCVIWICETGNCDVFRVVPKGTLEEKKEWFNDRDKYIGQQLKVKFFELTDDGIPRFPVGLGFRLEEDQ